MEAIYQELPKDQHGKLKKFKTGDWETRKGCTKKPIAIRQFWSFSITHKWIHAMQWLGRIVCHLAIGLHQWDKTAPHKAEVKEMEAVIQAILSPTKVGPGEDKAAAVGVAYNWPDAKVGSIMTQLNTSTRNDLKA